VGFKAFMSESGVDDFRRVSDGALAAGLQAATRLGVVVGVHAESHEMVERLGREMRERHETGRLAWCRARPPAAEVEAIRRLVSCVRGAGPGARAHVVHVSTAEGLAEVGTARDWGLSVTAETCPHYLDFDEQDFERVGPALKCAPPIRDAASRERLWTALLAGEVDVVASDHSPCLAADKKKGEHDVWQAWGGVAGIQATLPVLLTSGAHARGLSLERVADLTATAPARLFGLYPRKGVIAIGADADFAIVDPQRTWTFGPEHLQTRSGISPYFGRRFRGAAIRTIVRGRTVFADGEIVGMPGWGTLLRPAASHAN
jgi:allantoinase